MSAYKISRAIAPTSGFQILGGPLVTVKPPVAYFHNGTGNSATPNGAGVTAPIPNIGATSIVGDSTLIAAYNISTGVFTAPYNGKFKIQGMQQWSTPGAANYYQVNLVPFNDQTKAIYTASMYQNCQPFAGTFLLNKNDTVLISASQTGTSWGSPFSRLQIIAEYQTV